MTVKLKLRNNDDTYGWPLISLHWLMAVAVFGLYFLGLYIIDMSYYDPNYKTLPHWHRSVGMLVLLALGLRLLCRCLDRSPRSLPGHGLATRVMTRSAHTLLYLLMLVALASGYVMSTADGYGVQVFNWFAVPALPIELHHQADRAGWVHYWSSTALVALSCLHALAALKHHFIDKDSTLTRILGIKRESP
ncbi:cytochrome b [Marinobacterium rhizophilum]|uniref:Cytochrome b n=1 Tax=Marinobacterium rhizophilum TaxID=420402 RepID=A0ABY5HND4_9GAMM|nr:cytochrome b [Marinobacterium rhizophilum]UTW13376.1 cytochrome b [Marinobacterium rhizophilum]